MEKFKLALKSVREVADILCNICGESCKIPIGGGCFNIEAVTVKADFGYGSDRDGEHHEAHLCQGCYEARLLPLFTLNAIETSGY